jgi:hypothetical protein
MIGIDFAINVAAGIALVAFGAISRKAVVAYKTRNERRLWRPFRTKGNLAIAVTTRPGPLARSTPRVSLTEIRVLIKLIPTLEKLGIHYHLIDSTANSLGQAGDFHLLVLGGPATNELTREALKILQPRLPAGFDLSTLAVAVADRRYTPKYNNGTGTVDLDYGMVVRISNPFSSDDSLSAIFVMGCHGYGTAGAARILTSEKLAAELLMRVRDDPFLAILETKVAGSHFDTRLREVYPLSPLP